jgi:hypothetical protein
VDSQASRCESAQGVRHWRIRLKSVGLYYLIYLYLSSLISLSFHKSLTSPVVITRNGDGQRAGRAAMARVAGASGGPENGASNSSATE